MLRNHKVAAGIALAVTGLASAPSFAVTPAQYIAAAGSRVNIYYSGATATDNVLENYFLVQANGACAPGTIDIFRVAVTNRLNRVITCRITGTQIAGFPASSGTIPETGGTVVAFHKESIGGSSNGVVPVANQTVLDFIDTPSLMATLVATPATCGTVAVVNTGSTVFNTYNNYPTCPDVTTPVIPQGGISDTEPQLSFPSTTAGLVSKPGVAIVFGVPVTTKLYRALQIAQGLTPDDTKANVPNLSTSQIRGLYSQKITDWSQLRTAANVSLNLVPGVTGPVNPGANGGSAVADTKVFICRRVATSGTQASAESYFLQKRCDAKNGSTAAQAFAGGDPIVGTTPAAQLFGQRVTPGEGSGDVRTCMLQHDNNGTWAIGVLSTEVSASNLSGSQFRMVKIDGALPNLASVANGSYTYFTENTLNRSSNVSLPALTAALFTDIETNIGRPAVVAQSNTTFEGRPWGDGGVLTIAGSAGSTPNTPAQVDGAGTSNPPTVNTMRGNPVNTQTRTVGTLTNNCSPPIMRQPSPLAPF